MVFEKGRRISSPHLIVYSIPNGLDYPRLGLAVGKKTGNAAVRNRIKRRVREILRVRAADILPACDLVIVAKQSSGDAAFCDLEKTLGKVLRQLSDEKNSDTRDQTV